MNRVSLSSMGPGPYLAAEALARSRDLLDNSFLISKDRLRQKCIENLPRLARASSPIDLELVTLFISGTKITHSQMSEIIGYLIHPDDPQAAKKVTDFLNDGQAESQVDRWFGYLNK